MYRTCSTPKNKITRNILGSERELRIEGFMTAGFANRPLGEAGGVSRNRLLVDKMIVWCTILGLIMASSQRQSHNLLAIFQRPTPRARDQRKQSPAMRAPTPRISRLDFINSAMSTAAARASAADLPRTFGSALASQRSARERLPEDSGEYFLVALSWKLSAYNRGSRDRDLRFGHMRQVEIPFSRSTE